MRSSDLLNLFNVSRKVLRMISFWGYSGFVNIGMSPV